MFFPWCSQNLPNLFAGIIVSRDVPGGALVESLTWSFQRAANELIRDGPSGMAGGDPSGLKEQQIDRFDRLWESLFFWLYK